MIPTRNSSLHPEGCGSDDIYGHAIVSAPLQAPPP